MEIGNQAAEVVVAALERDMEEGYERVRALVCSNAVVVFTMSGCCMGHVVKQLLFGLGVGPVIIELDREGEEVFSFLRSISGGGQAVPSVFIGGSFLGGIEAVLACHINGSLVPLLKHAGALWL